MSSAKRMLSPTILEKDNGDKIINTWKENFYLIGFLGLLLIWSVFLVTNIIKLVNFIAFKMLHT